MDITERSDFADALKNIEIPTLLSAVGAAISAYIESVQDKDGADNSVHAKLEGFFKAVHKKTGVQRSTGARDKDGIFSEGTLSKYVTRMKAGDGDPKFPTAVYFWFHVHTDNPKYARRIDEELFGKGVSFEQKYDARFVEKKRSKEQPVAVSAGQEQPHVGLIEAEPTSWQPPEYHPPTQFNDAQWLSPENPNGIPFVARDDEIKRLDAFASDKKRMFQIWAVIAPSGAGKTRLILEWIRDPDKLQGWRKCVIKPHHKDDAGWQDWQPDKPTLLVIDYISGFETFIRALIDRFSDQEQGLHYPIKLLVLDHIFPEDFGKITELPRWGLSDLSGTATDRVGEYFFDQAPMLLDKADDLERIIHGVIARVSGKNVDDQSVKNAAEYLSKEKGAWHPLFAALVGFALSKQEVFSNYSKWNRLELIHYYLNGADRLPWRHKSPDSIWASCFIVVATLRRGVKIDLLMEYVPVEGRLAATSRKAILDLCNPVISSPDRLNLPPFEPDILGESFFLLFLKHCLEPANRGHFMQMLSGGGMPLQINDAREFAGVMQRLARNLSNDNQEAEETKEYWERLENFLTPDRFPEKGPFRWSVAIACFEIFRILQDKELTALAQRFLRRVKADDLYMPPTEKPRAAHILSALRYFEVSRKGSDTIPPLLATLLASYDPQNSGGVTALMMASEVGSLPVVDHLIDMKADVDAVSDDRWTALMFACAHDQQAVALRLIEKCKNLDAVSDDRWTALMIACRNGQETVALELVEKCKNLDAASDEGGTALMIACRYDQETVALRLVEKCKDLDAANDKGWTALMYACRHDQETVALKLVEKCKNLDAANDEHGTALMIACRNGQETVALELVEKCKNLDAASDEGWTALMYACRHDQETVALRLVEKCKDLDAANDKGWTALMYACRHDQETVALRLIEKCKNLDAVSDDRWTALMFACAHDQQAVALRLIEKCKNLDAASDEGVTALVIACCYDQETVALELVEKCKNLDAASGKGWTALMYACRHDQETVALRLVEKCKNLDAASDEGGTALMIACRYDQETVALELVEKCKDLDAVNDKGWTALMIACRYDQEAVALRLVEKCKNLDAVSDDRWTALMYACAHDQEKVALMMIEKEANINQTGKGGITVLMIACLNNCKAVVRLLIDKHVRLDDVWQHEDIQATALGLARDAGHQEIVEMLEEAGALELPLR